MNTDALKIASDVMKPLVDSGYGTGYAIIYASKTLREAGLDKAHAKAAAEYAYFALGYDILDEKRTALGNPNYVPSKKAA